MYKRYIVTIEDAEKIRDAMSKKENARHYKRLLAVALRGEGKKDKEIAEITHYNQKRVSQLVALFCNEGLEALNNDGRKGGNNRKMSSEEEKEILESFSKRAQSGQVITVEEIKRKIDEKLGENDEAICLASVYNLLHRNNWRRVMPRAQHPNKAKDEDIESSKKLTKNSEI